jgi:GNAT superfamily N-acetyltransferase
VRAETEAWQDAVARGFLGGEPTDTQHEVFFAGAAYRRKIGVYDAQGPLAALPVATFASWVGELTLPGGTIPACAISAVTVAPTHRRRGILRSVMAGELRAAADLGVPIAALTVSESTIYGRFGFGAAIPATTWRSTRGAPAGWAPRRPDGSTSSAAKPGATSPRRSTSASASRRRGARAPPGHVDRFFGTRADAEKADQLRVVQYRRWR